MQIERRARFGFINDEFVGVVQVVVVPNLDSFLSGDDPPNRHSSAQQEVTVRDRDNVSDIAHGDAALSEAVAPRVADRFVFRVDVITPVAVLPVACPEACHRDDPPPVDSWITPRTVSRSGVPNKKGGVVPRTGDATDSG